MAPCWLRKLDNLVTGFLLASNPLLPVCSFLPCCSLCAHYVGRYCPITDPFVSPNDWSIGVLLERERLDLTTRDKFLDGLSAH